MAATNGLELRIALCQRTPLIDFLASRNASLPFLLSRFTEPYLGEIGLRQNAHFQSTEMGYVDYF